MLNTLFTMFYEIQIGDTMPIMIMKGLNCLLLFWGVERFLDFAIRKWNQLAAREEEVEEKTMNPIGFR